MSSGSWRNHLADEQWMRYSHGSTTSELLAQREGEGEVGSSSPMVSGNRREGLTLSMLVWAVP